MLPVDRPYCLLHRDGRFRWLAGEIQRVKLLADLPRPAPGPDAWPLVSMVPYAQLRERGFRVHDDGETILTLLPRECRDVTAAEIGTGAVPVVAGEPRLRVSDAAYAAMVAEVVEHEINRGEGSNFLLSRTCDLDLAGFDAAAAHEVFLRLARNELGAYLTFCFFDGERWFLGASPERHLTVEAGAVTMNPICGTLPKAALRGRADLVDFLTDPKEVNELFQVVDEELKMMARICAGGGVVRGPYLKEMSSVVHTEYELHGRTTRDPVDAFRESMFAATMIGSPLENAARVIYQYEPESRRYYSSAVLLLDRDDAGGERLDSAITIRMMEVDAAGHAVLRSGASIVRDSDPAKETAEVRAKLAGMLLAVTGAEPGPAVLPALVDDSVKALLRSRNDRLSAFWQAPHDDRPPAVTGPAVLLMDNEDEFTHMLAHLLRRLGCATTVLSWDDPALDGELGRCDLLLVGPGPGDPEDRTDPKMRRIDQVVADRLEAGLPLLAVCLGHQVLCARLGLPIRPSDPPMQGVQHTVDLFGRAEPVGLYCTFFARSGPVPAGVELAAGPDGRVVAVRGPGIYGVQFHPESVLTTNCVPILADVLAWLSG